MYLKRVSPSNVNVFIDYGSGVLFYSHATSPAMNTDLSDYDNLFAITGYSGCIRSTDVINVGILSCTSWAHINYMGHKLSIPSRTYNATVTHCRQILGTTCGHPAKWNNKSTCCAQFISTMSYCGTITS